MSELDEVLRERGNDYGDFECMARVSQELKKTMASGETPFVPAQQEAIDMICHKLSRLACGNANKKDTWLDIAGYATLISNTLEMKR